MKRLSIGLIGILAAPLLGACGEMYEPSHITPHRAQAMETQFFEQRPVADITPAYIAQAAKDYKKSARGPMDVAVTYDPLSKAPTARDASKLSRQLKESFARNGVKDVKVGVLPIAQGEGPQVLVSYAAYEALPPKDCTLMTGLRDTEVGPETDYKLGCSVESSMTQQIRPKDLAGRGETGGSDGRRASNIIEKYRTGEPNEKLEGESASGD